MELPILGRLKDGEKFDFDTLADNVEQTYEFWQWWWEEKSQDGIISRPEIILDNDVILTPTDEKCSADLIYRQEFFDKTLFHHPNLFPNQIIDMMVLILYQQLHHYYVLLI